jgi:hypothetical protein
VTLHVPPRPPFACACQLVRQEGISRPSAPDTPKDQEVDAFSRRKAWARLLAKVHALDIMACPCSGSRMSVISDIRPSGVR